MKHQKRSRRLSSLASLSIITILIVAAAPSRVLAKISGTNPCPRFAPGSVVSNPPALFSHGGVLSVNLTYNTETDADGRTLYCFTTPGGQESPTLWVNPGDRLIVHVTNNLPVATDSNAMRMATSASNVCGSATMDQSSVNIHFHGTNVPPVCHEDEVIHTLINAGQTFTYNLGFPLNEPPGLYWYHPHVHGISESALQGGATGAIVVQGLANLQPAVKGLTQRILLIRDQTGAGNPGVDPNAPSWDVTLNYVPIPYPSYPPAVIQMKPGQKQLWRVVNSCADTITDLQLLYDGVPQTLQVVGLDGVPTGSQDGTRRGKSVNLTDILLAPAARAEFIVTGPATSVKNATLMTLGIDTGPEGDATPPRPLATIQTVVGSGVPVRAASIESESNASAETASMMPAVVGKPGPQRFEGLATATPTATRTLFFSETTPNGDPDDLQTFFITVQGQSERAFNPNNPPAITTTQGSVEDWTIENHAMELHEFHIHQIHFLLMAINGVPATPDQQQMLDMAQVGYWTGTGPYPSITVRMDFRGKDVGDFVYHCHILGHEDNGMMAIIRVLPAPKK
jgi:FtsP/CotA-like multicopper oxidase with cupredoxin domain